MPGAPDVDQNFVGSVISVQSDRTTLSIAFDGEGPGSEYYGDGPGPETITVGGTTYVGYVASVTDEENNFTETVAMECARENGNAVPTCAYSTLGQGPESRSNTEPLTSTMTMSGDMQYYLNNAKLVITAGTEKLSASAAATPIASGAQSTGTPSTAASASSNAASSGAAQATGAAAPIRSVAPVLAGLGAAAAFFV